MRYVVIVTDLDGTNSVVGPFRSEASAGNYGEWVVTAREGVDVQVTPLEGVDPEFSSKPAKREGW